jgi:hemerythrin
LQWSEETYALGIGEIDSHHRQFVQLLSATSRQEDSALFIKSFHELNEHLIQHFSAEEKMMDACDFSARAEHKGEHRRILGEMNQFKRQLDRGRTVMARAYVSENLPRWFGLHVTTMDSALAAKMKT